MKPLLSICIATYNRAAFIGATLDSIIPQLTDQVEIVVVDGASTDNTEEIMHHYIKRCDSLRYIRLPVKGGVDQDYCKAVDFASGKMCWLFPDDDLIGVGAISTLLSEIHKGYSLIIVNAKAMNVDFSRVLSKNLLRIDSNKIFKKDEFDQLFQLVIFYMSFIGCVVIERDLWLKREKERYFGSQFIHLGVIFQSPLPSPVLVIAEPFITIRYGNAQWAHQFFEIWMYKWPNLLFSFTSISEHIRQDFQIQEPWKNLKVIILYRAKGAYSKKEYKKWFMSEKTPFWGRAVLLLVALIPYVLINRIILLYYKLFKKDELLTIYDLENKIYIS